MIAATIRPVAPGPLPARTIRAPALVGVPLAGLALVLAGCAVAPARPTAPAVVSSAWSAPLPHGGSAESLAHWWSRFDDPLLAGLIETAQRESPTLAQAAQRIVEARANARIAGAALAPTLDANARSTRGNTLMIGAGLPAATTMSSGTLDARWEVDLFGAARQRESAALARAKASAWQWHDARVSLAAEVADTYVGLRSCEALLDLFDAQARSLAATESLTREKVDAGFAAPAELALAQATAAEARARSTAQRADCDVAVGQLAMLTAQPATTLRPALAQRHAQLPEPEGFAVHAVPAQVLSQRPDLAAAERAAIAAAAEVDAAQADRFPRLALTGSIGRSALRFAGQTFAGSTWSFAPSLAASLFDAGRRSAGVDAARARLAIAEADWRARALGAVREVEEALVRLDAADRRLDDSRRAVDGYRAFLVAATTQWEVGTGSLLDLEQARRNAQNAGVTLTQTRRERIAAWLALYKAIGGGWSTNE